MRKINVTILSTILFLFAGKGILYAQQLPSEGVWGEYNKATPASGEVTLTGDVYMKGPIRVQAGTSLIIRSNKDVTIYNDGIVAAGGDSNSRMFTINSPSGDKGCGSLKIVAAEGCTITIDGGANYEWSDYQLAPGNGSRGLSSCIATGGELELTNVKIQDVKGLDSYGGAIDISEKTAMPVTLTNCVITRCYSQLGAAIMLQGKHDLRISDSEISYCNSGGGGNQNSGGAIRTLGNVSASLYLTRVHFHHNYAQRNINYDHTFEKDGNGGALFWNARGTEDTKCVIDGCLFEYNKCDDNGGAIKSQATLHFEGEATTISNNTAPIGAGLYIEGYTGGAQVGEARVIEYDLNENLIIKNNTAPSYVFEGQEVSGKGAGIHYFFGPDMTLEEGSTINVNLNGAQIKNNTASGTSGQGGGIYFENTSKEGQYNFGINLSHGLLESNTSTGNGGGIYVYMGDVSSTLTEGKSLTVSNNKAKNGAGIYIQGGDLLMANGDITNNTLSHSGNGAGIFIEGGSFEMNDGSITLNKATESSSNGGGVFIMGGGSFTMDDGTITDNQCSANGGGVFIEGGSFEMNGGSITLNEATESSSNGGGVYINGGSFTLNNGNIAQNESSSNGGGVFIMGGGSFTMIDGTIANNQCSVNGGGVYLDNGNFDLVNGEISGNSVSQNGGGVYLTGPECIYKLRNGEIKQNSSAKGGGVYLETGSFILADDMNDNGVIQGNTSSSEGGGVYISSDGDFTMNGGLIQSNTSNTNGGGAFLAGGSLNMNNGTIVSNSSRINGGGIYLNGGSLTVEAGSISSNTATSNGGGVYIMNGNVNMGDGWIQDNISSEYGGGVYVYNSENTNKTVNFSGGTLAGNEALYGGGICVNGIIGLNIEEVEIANNSARNGGGVCLMNGANMIFSSGQIKNNLALKSADSDKYTNTTAYLKEVDELEGMGGGVFLDTGTRMEFRNANELGLFGNIADNGGDEIFANGNNTWVNLPDVKEMALSDYDGASNLRWIEDYTTNDTDYDKGTKLMGANWDGGKTNMRYRDAMKLTPPVYFYLDEAVELQDKYVCYALGYEVIYITIQKYGLEEGESAIFTLSNNSKNYRIIITGDGNEIASKRVAVTAGSWTIREDDWAWTYDVSDEAGNALADRQIIKDITDENNRLFVFRNTKRNPLPMNHESIVVRNMGN